MSRSNTAGILTLHAESNSQILNLHTEVPQQTMILTSVRVHMSSDAVSLATGIVYADFPWLQQSSLVDGQESFCRLPILLSGSAVTIYCPMIPIAMVHNVRAQTTVKLYNDTGAPLANLVSATFQFSYGTGTIL